LLKLAFAAREGGFSGGDFGSVLLVFADVIENRRFQAAETKVERIPFHLDGAKFDGSRDVGSGYGEAIEDWAAGIAKAEKFGDFVVGFPGCVVACLTEFAIAELRGGFGASSLLGADFVKNGVTARDDEADRGKLG